MQPRNDALQPQRGVSLIEALCAMAVASVVLGVSLPGLSALGPRAELAGVAAQLETDVQFARGQATALGSTVRLSLHERAGGTCYMVHTGAAAQCSCTADGTASCSGEATVLRAVALAPGAAVQVRSTTRSMVFDPLKGTVTPTATLRVEASDGRAIHQVVNLLGRVRTCSPGARTLGEAAC